MKICRLQFETRYTHLLDFKDKYKSLLNPYLTLKDLRFTIANEGTVNETLKLTFHESFYEFEVMFDKIVFRYEGDPDDLLKPNSQIKTHFDILEKIKSISTFQKINVNVFAAWAINATETIDDKIDDKKEWIANNFKKKYLSDQVDFFQNKNDYRLSVESGDEQKFSSLTFGPYTPKDFKRHTISIFNSPWAETCKGVYGTLAIVQINEQSDKSKHENFKQLYTESNNLLSKLNG